MRLFLVLLLVLSGCTASKFNEAQHHLDEGRLAEGYAMFLELAKAGDSRSQFYVGSMLVRGRGVPRDCEAGLRWLYSSSELGESSASFAIYVLAKSHIHECKINDIELSQKYKLLAKEQGYKFRE